MVPSVTTQCQQRPSASGSLVRDLLALPPSTSVLAHVAAMHNYSSQATGEIKTGYGINSSHFAASRSRQRDDVTSRIQSAPQSPTSTAFKHQVDDRFMSISTPSSPVGISHHGHKGFHRRHSSAKLHRPCSDSEHSVSVVHRKRNNGGKRALHNVLERRRRDHLKWNFEALRCAVPSAAANSRMPKVVILRRARDYVRLLRAAGERLEAERNRLQNINKHLQGKFFDFVKAA